MPRLKAIHIAQKMRFFDNFRFAHRRFFLHCPETLMGLSASKILNGLHWTLTAAAGIAAGVAVFSPPLSPTLDGLIIALAAIASVTALARQLPVESVAFAAFVAALIGGAAHGLSAQTGIPFGPLAFGETAGPKLFNLVPWTLPLLWVVAIFNSRGVVRLILRPWRKVKNYGLWLLGLTAALSMAFDLALEPFAAHAKHLWFWQPTKIAVTWHGVSPLGLLGWLAVSLIILAFVMPYLIRKQPGNPSTPDFAPLALWLGAIVYFAIGSAQAELWSAVVADGIIAVGVAVFSVRGAKW
jgi:putative membrane protein